MDSILLVAGWVFAVSLALAMAFGAGLGWQRSRDYFDKLGRPKHIDGKPVIYTHNGTIVIVGGLSQRSTAWLERYVARYNRKLKPGQIPLGPLCVTEYGEVNASRDGEPVPFFESGSDPASFGQRGQPTFEAVSEGAVTTLASDEPVQEPDYDLKLTPEADRSDAFETQPFTETWKAGSLSKVEMTESMLILETDDSSTFVVDDASTPDFVHKLNSLGYDVEVKRLPDSDPPAYVVELRKPR